MIQLEEKKTTVVVSNHDLSNRTINLTQRILLTAADTATMDKQIRREVQAAMGISNGLICMFELAKINDTHPVKIRKVYVQRASDYFTKKLGRKVEVLPHPSITEPEGLFI